MRNSEWTFLLQPTVFFSYMDKSAVQKIRVILIGFRGIEGWLNFICCFVWFQKFSTLEAASTLKTGTSSVHVHYDRVQQREYIVVLYEKLSHRMEVVFVSTTPSFPADMPIPEDEQGTGEEIETAQAPCAATRPRRLTMPNIRISSQEWKKKSICKKKW